MELLSLVGISWLLLYFSIVFHFDTRRPMSIKIKYKYRVKDNSIFRKIIKFKDKKYHPCIYYKIVPIYVFLLLSIGNSCILLIDIFANGIVSHFISEKVLIIILCISGVSIIYYFVIIIWWEIVDEIEMHLNKEEKSKMQLLRRKNCKKKSNRRQ